MRMVLWLNLLFRKLIFTQSFSWLFRTKSTTFHPPFSEQFWMHFPHFQFDIKSKQNEERTKRNQIRSIILHFYRRQNQQSYIILFCFFWCCCWNHFDWNASNSLKVLLFASFELVFQMEYPVPVMDEC